MAEWSIASDLKSDELQGSVSSNLTLSFSYFLFEIHFTEKYLDEMYFIKIRCIILQLHQ